MNIPFLVPSFDYTETMNDLEATRLGPTFLRDFEWAFWNVHSQALQIWHQPITAADITNDMIVRLHRLNMYMEGLLSMMKVCEHRKDVCDAGKRLIKIVFRLMSLSFEHMQERMNCYIGLHAALIFRTSALKAYYEQSAVAR